MHVELNRTKHVPNKGRMQAYQARPATWVCALATFVAPVRRGDGFYAPTSARRRWYWIQAVSSRTPRCDIAIRERSSHPCASGRSGRQAVVPTRVMLARLCVRPVGGDAYSRAIWSVHRLVDGKEDFNSVIAWDQGRVRAEVARLRARALIARGAR